MSTSIRIARIDNRIGNDSKTFLSQNYDIIGKSCKVPVEVTMQGRDGRGSSANRGRGRNHRGGRGMASSPPRTGTIAAIGAYLDLIPGKEVNPGVVINWINKFTEYLTAVCDTPKINLNP